MLDVLAAALYGYLRCLVHLRDLQQDAYLPKRYLKWIWRKKAFDGVGVLIAAVSYSVGFAPLWVGLYWWFTKDPRKEGIVKLHMTARAKRIFYCAWGIYLLFLLLLPNPFWLSCAFLFQLMPLCTVGAWAMTWPDEQRRQKGFTQQAKKRLREVDPFVIGITGSYGKTSTKEALGEILNLAVGPTFWPPKGVNTDMGICREINTRLSHKYAVIEMGAYQKGSIARLCRLTPPKGAIITYVGQAHLERFGSEEVIWQAKSELAQAVPDDGILVCNGDNQGARRIAEIYPKQTTLLYGFDHVINWQMDPSGMRFTLKWREKSYRGMTKMHGRPALSNLLGAFTMACQLGANPEYVLGIIANLEPVANRLQVEQGKEEIWVHDAYNSNPVGFEAALEVLQMLPGKRRILITPGMIELGNQQHTENKRLASIASTCCDLALFVGSTNCEALGSGFTKESHFVADKFAAFDYLKKHKRPGDVILLENDLPDLYQGVKQ